MAKIPSAEFEIDAAVIRALLAEQAPHLAHLPLQRVASGWDNEMWRLGTDLAVRLPRRALAESLIAHEQRWLPQLAPQLPVGVPVPVVAGTPTAAHPRPWNVVAWLPGEPLADRPGSAAVADALAGFLAALHQPAPPEAPVNEWRGVPLPSRADRVMDALQTIADRGETELSLQLGMLWRTLVETPAYDGPPVWLHGDLHPLNLLVEGDELTAVIDFGDLTSGDPASDLAVAWMAFEPSERLRLIAGLPNVDRSTWRRARGWALALGAIVMVHADDDPVLATTARAALRRVLDGTGGE